MEELLEQRKVGCAAIVGLLKDAMIPRAALEVLEKLMESTNASDGMEFCERAEDSALSTPFVNHVTVFQHLDRVYEALNKVVVNSTVHRTFAFVKHIHLLRRKWERRRQLTKSSRRLSRTKKRIL